MENLEVHAALDDLKRVRMTGITNAQAVICKCCVASIGSSIDIAIARCNVPVRLIESSAMRQDLNACDTLRSHDVRNTDCCVNVVCVLDRNVPSDATSDYCRIDLK